MAKTIVDKEQAYIEVLFNLFVFVMCFARQRISDKDDLLFVPDISS